MLAVTRTHDRRLFLYRLEETRHASLVRTIDPPRDLVSLDKMALSAGREPRVCAVWRDDDPRSDADGKELVCDGVGRVDWLEFGSMSVAMSPTGDRVFSGLEPEEGASRYTLTRLTDHAIARKRNLPIDCPRYLVSAGWGDDSHVVLHCSTGDSDDPGRLAWQELGDAPPAAVDIPVLPSQPRGYDLLLDPGGYLDGGVLAIQRVDCVDGCPVELSPRAVRVDPRTGKVLEVVATPASGRAVASVSGGSHGVVYSTLTRKGEDLRVYLRWPGEGHGKPVTGLPSDVDDVVAQP